VRILENNFVGKNENVKGISNAHQHCHRVVGQSVHRSVPRNESGAALQPINITIIEFEHLKYFFSAIFESPTIKSVLVELVRISKIKQ
jgi:hypothetical protein